MNQIEVDGLTPRSAHGPIGSSMNIEKMLKAEFDKAEHHQKEMIEMS
jgi:hypothetical protein